MSCCDYRPTHIGVLSWGISVARCILDNFFNLLVCPFFLLVLVILRDPNTLIPTIMGTLKLKGLRFIIILPRSRTSLFHQHLYQRTCTYVHAHALSLGQMT